MEQFVAWQSSPPDAVYPIVYVIAPPLKFGNTNGPLIMAVLFGFKH
jgi:hypothetical protein